MTMQITDNRIRKNITDKTPRGNLISENSILLTDETIHYHGKIDWDVAKRILKVIYEEGNVKRTNLAMKAGLNYTSCMRYIVWLAEVKWIDLQNDNQIKLTSSGIQMCLCLVN